MGVSLLVAGVSCLAFFFDVSAAFESIGTDRVPIFDRPVSGRETLSQLVFVLALHFVQHLDGSPPGHGQPVQTHCCSYLQPQRWPTSAHVMSRPGSDDSPGSSPLAAPAAAAEDARDQRDHRMGTTARRSSTTFATFDRAAPLATST